MKKKVNGILSLGMALALLFTGCTTGQSSKPNDVPSQGGNLPLATTGDEGPYHYELEEIYSFLDSYRSPFQLNRTEDGQILYVDSYVIGRLANDGEEKDSIVLNFGENHTVPEGETEDVQRFLRYDADYEGNLYILYGNYTSNDDGSEYTSKGYWHLDAFDKAGNKTISNQRIDMQDKSLLESAHPTDFQCQDGLVYLLFPNYKVEVTTLEGDPVAFPQEELMIVYGMVFDENGLLYLAISTYGRPGSYEVLQMDPSNNYEILNRQRIPDYVCDYTAYSKETGKLFCANEEQIISVQFDESLENGSRYQTELRFGKDLPLTLGGFYDSGLQVLEDMEAGGEDLYLSTRKLKKREEEGYEIDVYLYRLRKTPGEYQKPEQQIEHTLTITASYRQDFLEEAVRLYQVEHPEVAVKWDVFYNSREEFLPNADEAGQKLATKIMANDVGDIVATGGMGLDYYNILQTDAFLDLTDRVAGSERYSELNQSMLKAMTLNGKLNGLPIGTVTNVIRYTNTLQPSLKVDTSMTWSDILQIGLDNPERPLFGSTYSKGGEAMNLVVSIINSNLWDTIDFESKTADLHQPWFMDLLKKLKAVYQQGNLSTQIATNSLGLPDYQSRDYFFELLTLQRHYYEYREQYDATEGGVTLFPMPRGEKNSNRFSYAFVMYSISSRSKQPDAAWALLDYLTSYEAQTLSSLNSTPINYTAEQRARQIITGDFPEELGKQLDLVESDIEFLYDTGVYRLDTYQPLTKYVIGKYTLDQALEEAEYNLWLRLNE